MVVLLLDEGGEDTGFRASDHVSANQFADLRGDLLTGIDGGTHRSDVAANDGGNVSSADLDLADERHIGSLEHRVRSFNLSDEPLGFNQSDSIIHDRGVFLSVVVNFDRHSRESAEAAGILPRVQQ